MGYILKNKLSDVFMHLIGPYNEDLLKKTNLNELKKAKSELRKALSSNALLKDIEDNDPAGIKEITLELKENAYSLGLDLQYLMSLVVNYNLFY